MIDINGVSPLGQRGLFEADVRVKSEPQEGDSHTKDGKEECFRCREQLMQRQADNKVVGFEERKYNMAKVRRVVTENPGDWSSSWRPS